MKFRLPCFRTHLTPSHLYHNHAASEVANDYVYCSAYCCCENCGEPTHAPINVSLSTEMPEITRTGDSKSLSPVWKIALKEAIKICIYEEVNLPKVCSSIPPGGRKGVYVVDLHEWVAWI